MSAVSYLALFFIGAICASFATVVAERLNTGESWLQGRSRCNACGRALSARDLVPVLSFVMYRGRCRTCTSAIPRTYAILEIALGSAFVLLYMRIGATPELFLFFALLFVLAIIVVYDLRHTIVPFRLSLFLVLIGALIAVLSAKSSEELSATFLVAAAISLLFYLMHLLSRGRWMGLGDTPVALALSLSVDTHAFTGLLFSFWSGAVFGIALLVLEASGRTINREVPFVPFLAFGYILAFVTQWNLFTLI